MNRSALIAGPAKYVFGAAAWYNKNPAEIKIEQETINIAPDALGKLDERVIEVEAKLSVVPEGRWNADLIAALHPHTNATIGSNIFTDTDVPLAVHASDGALHTIVSAAVTKQPNIRFSVKETLVEAVEITGLRGNDKAWSDANGIYTVAGGSTFADAGWTGPALIKTQPYFLTWGAVAGFSAIDTEEGFTFETTLELQPMGTDALGRMTYKFKSLGAMVRFMPVGPTSAQILAAMNIQGGSAVRGQSLSSGEQLTIVGADTVTYLTIPDCGLKSAGYRFGSTTLRHGEIGIVAVRTFSAGAQQPLYTLADS